MPNGAARETFEVAVSDLADLCAQGKTFSENPLCLDECPSSEEVRPFYTWLARGMTMLLRCRYIEYIQRGASDTHAGDRVADKPVTCLRLPWGIKVTGVEAVRLVTVILWRAFLATILLYTLLRVRGLDLVAEYLKHRGGVP